MKVKDLQGSPGLGAISAADLAAGISKLKKHNPAAQAASAESANKTVQTTALPKLPEPTGRTRVPEGEPGPGPSLAAQGLAGIDPAKDKGAFRLSF